MLFQKYRPTININIGFISDTIKIRTWSNKIILIWVSYYDIFSISIHKALPPYSPFLDSAKSWQVNLINNELMQCCYCKLFTIFVSFEVLSDHNVLLNVLQFSIWIIWLDSHLIKSVNFNIIIHGGSLDHDIEFYSLEFSYFPNQHTFLLNT